MAAVNKISSNVTGTRLAEEAIGTIGVLPGTPTWKPAEVNSYGDFGAEITKVARSTINPDRQRQKGDKVDIDASFAWNTDVTQTNISDELQGFMFASYRPKGEENPTSATVQAGDDTYEMASTTGFFVGSLVWASGFTNAANNGLKRVTAVVADTTIAVAETLVTEGSPPADAQVVVVGFQFVAGDLDSTAAGGGNFPTYTTSTKDMTELGLIPGEWIFVGGDTASLALTDTDGSGNEINNGRKRVRSVAANVMTIDKSDFTMTTESSTTETVQIFFGRVLKNELASLIVTRSYQAERQLGAPDSALPAQIQAQYLIGGIANELTLNTNTADKLNADLAFIALNEERYDGPTALKTGNRPDAPGEAFFNTSSDVKRIALSQVVAGDENVTPLFAYVENFTLTINNNATTDKAVGVEGGFDVTVGDFEVGGQISAYFADIAAVTAVNNNDNVSFDFHLYKNNAGWAVDLPLVTLADGRPTVEKDRPVLIPLAKEAVTGKTIDAGLDHTLMFVFYDYLPTKAAS